MEDDTVPTQSGTLSLSLLANAYDSFEESLTKVEMASTKPSAWKFAVLHIVHSVELMIKESLVRAHPLLLWENVDRPQRRTVSLEQGLERLIAAGVDVNGFDKVAIKAAINWRNQITHYRVDLQIDEVRANYLFLFEFLNAFHKERFNDSLTLHLSREALSIGSSLMVDFRTDMVDFRGRPMHRTWAWKLLAAQEIQVVTVDGTDYERIVWGAEPHWSEPDYKDSIPLEFCRDCACAINELHGPMCSQESCPRCKGQLISCGCDLGDSQLGSLLDIEEHWEQELNDWFQYLEQHPVEGEE